MRFSIKFLQLLAEPGVPGCDDKEGDDGADENQVAHNSNPLSFSAAAGGHERWPRRFLRISYALHDSSTPWMFRDGLSLEKLKSASDP